MSKETLLEILADVEKEARKSPEEGQESLRRYWQGKLDGIRIALVLLENDEDALEQQYNSPTSIYVTSELEVIMRKRK